MSWLEQNPSGSSISSTSTSDSEGGSSAIHSISPLPEPRPERESLEVFKFAPKTCRQDEQAKNVGWKIFDFGILMTIDSIERVRRGGGYK